MVDSGPGLSRRRAGIAAGKQQCVGASDHSSSERGKSCRDGGIRIMLAHSLAGLRPEREARRSEGSRDRHNDRRLPDVPGSLQVRREQARRPTDRQVKVTGISLDASL